MLFRVTFESGDTKLLNRTSVENLKRFLEFDPDNKWFQIEPIPIRQAFKQIGLTDEQINEVFNELIIREIKIENL
jgi:hypothetical protein